MIKIFAGVFLALFVGSASAGPIMEWNFTMLASDWFGVRDGSGADDHREFLIGTLRYEEGARSIQSLSARSMDKNYSFATYSTQPIDLLYDYYTESNQYAWRLDIPVKDSTGKDLYFSFGEIFVWVQSEREYATLDNSMRHYVGWITETNESWNDPNHQLRFIDGEFFLNREVTLPAVRAPEPASIGLMSLALIGLAATRRRKQA